MDTKLIWKAQYMNTSLICIAAFIAAGILCLWFAKRKFIRQNLAQNRMLTRLSRIENKLIMTVGLSFVIFNAVSNHEINQQIFNYERTLYNRIYELIAWNKDIMENGDSYRKMCIRDSLISVRSVVRVHSSPSRTMKTCCSQHVP